MRLFITLIAWCVGYIFTIAAYMISDEYKGDSSESRARVMVGGIFVWPLLGMCVIADSIVELYKKKDNKNE